MLKFSLLDLLFVTLGLSDVSKLACTRSFLLTASLNEDRLCWGDFEIRALTEGIRWRGELLSLFLTFDDPSDVSVLTLRLLLPLAA